MKKKLALLLSLMMVFLLAPSTYASELPEISDEILGNDMEPTQGKDLILENFMVMDQGLLAVTELVSSEDEEIFNETKGHPERIATAYFTHRIYDTNGIEMVVFHSTVKGIYSEADGYANLSSITGYFTGPYATRFVYGTFIAGNLGAAEVGFNGALLGIFQYKIYTNGNIVNY